MDWRECGCSAELEYHEVVHNSASLSVLGYAVKTLLNKPFPPSPFLSLPSLSFSALPLPFSSLSHLLPPRFSSTQLQAAVKKIYDEYISPTSPHCINVDDKVQKAVESKLNNPPLNIFSEAQEQVRVAPCPLKSPLKNLPSSLVAPSLLFLSPPFLSSLSFSFNLPILFFYTLFSLPWDPNALVWLHSYLSATMTSYAP